MGGDTNWEFYSLLKYDDNNVIGIGGYRRSNGFLFDLFLGKYFIEIGDSVWTDIWIHSDQNYGLYGYDGAVFFDSSLVVLGQTIDATGIYSVIYLMNFAIAYNSVPVELTSFNASTNGDGNINLNWSTATETNNQGFEIERKSINNEFEKIGYVTGYGTTTEPKSYSFTDDKISTGKYSYRLRQIDFDGTFEYSNEIEIEVSIPNEYFLRQNYPNPFNPTTKIKYTISSDGNVTLTVYNM